MEGNELVRVDKGKAQLLLHPGQEKAWDSNRRFVFVIAGTQSGKTTFGPWWLYREIDRCGAGDYLAVTATYDLFKLKMLPEMLRVFVDWLPGWSYQKSERVIINDAKDTRIILRSAHTPGGLESATAKAALLDECGQDDFRLDSWEAVQRRLSLYQGRVLGATTPYNLGWLKTQIFDRWRDGDKNFDVIQFKSIMNPSFPREEYERAKTTLPDWKFRMFYDGEFSRPAGMIYSDFEQSIHVVRPRKLEPEWPRYVGIDFGAVNTAVLWIAEHPETGVLYLYREYLEGEKTTQGHTAYVKIYEQKENIIRYTGGAKSEKQQRWDWQAAGVPVQSSPIINVEAGIDRVIERLKAKTLFIFDNCKGIIDEMGTYSRQLDDNGQPTEKIKDKETYHRLDALRYNISAIDVPAVTTDPNPFYD